MPMMELTIPEGALSDDAKAKLPGEMAACLLRSERAPDTEFFRSISWTHVHELPADAIAHRRRPRRAAPSRRQGHDAAGRAQRPAPRRADHGAHPDRSSTRPAGTTRTALRVWIL